MPKHCPRCNRSQSDTKFYGEFCEVCMKEKLVAKLPIIVDMTFCRKCGKVWNGRTFKEPTNKALEDAILLKIKGYDLHLIDFDGETLNVEIAERTLDGLLVVDRILAIKRAKALCDECNKVSSGYYEATIQLRGNPVKVDRMKERITNYITKSSAFIARVDEEDSGINIFVSDKKVVMGMMLHMHLKPVISYTLYGEKAGKRVYRNTYALHL